MPKITRTTGTTVGAPDQSGVQQRIDVPRGAFGGQIAEAQERAGAGLQDAGNKLGQIAIRQQEREDTTAASQAAADYDLETQQLYEDMKRNPGDLNSFTDRLLSDMDKRAEEYTEGMSSGAKNMFMQKALGYRTTRGKSSISWKSQEFIRQGTAAINSELNNNIRAAGGDIANLNDYYARTEATVANGIAAGFIRTTAKRGVESIVRDEKARISKEAANALIGDNPAVLIQMLEQDALQGLSEGEKNTLSTRAVSALKNLDEKAAVTRLAGFLTKNEEAMDSYRDGTLDYKTVDDWERSGVIDPRVSSMLKDDLTVPEDVAFEATVSKKEKEIKTRQEARKRLGLDKDETRKPSVEEKLKGERSLATRFMEFSIDKNEDGEVTTEAQLNKLLDFQLDVQYAASQKLITRERASSWMNKILPLLKGEIDSKHFQGSKGFLGFGKRESDPYSSGFTHVLDALEKVPASNTLENQVRAIELVMDISEARNLDSIEDPVEKQKALQGIGKAALDALNKENYPSLSHVENMPDTVIGVKEPPPKAIDILRNDPSEKNRTFFDQTFGDGAAARILGE